MLCATCPSQSRRVGRRRRLHALCFFPNKEVSYPMDKMINLRINGKQVRARTGQTVLEAAKAAGVDIPNLCNHPALTPHGACRVCLVEIERQRTLQPACTFPVTAGMRVDTES